MTSEQLIAKPWHNVSLWRNAIDFFQCKYEIIILQGENAMRKSQREITSYCVFLFIRQWCMLSHFTTMKNVAVFLLSTSQVSFTCSARQFGSFVWLAMNINKELSKKKITECWWKGIIYHSDEKFIDKYTIIKRSKKLHYMNAWVSEWTNLGESRKWKFFERQLTFFATLTLQLAREYSSGCYGRHRHNIAQKQYHIFRTSTDVFLSQVLFQNWLTHMPPIIGFGVGCENPECQNIHHSMRSHSSY